MTVTSTYHTTADALQSLADAWADAGFPEHASGLVSVAAECPDLLSGWLDAEEFECGGDLLGSLRSFLSVQGQGCGRAAGLTVRLRTGNVTFVSPAEGIPPELHGRAISVGPSEYIVSDPRLAVAEAELLTLQAHVSDMVRISDVRVAREVRYLGSPDGATLDAASTEDGVIADFGLRKRRLDLLSLSVRALCRARGRLRDVSRDLKPYCDLRRTSAAAKMMSGSRLAELFSGFDIDGSVDEATAMGVSEGVGRLIDDGLLIPPPDRYDLRLRVRRFSHTGFSGQYSEVLQDILVSASCIGVLVHEYAHAMDAFLGRPSHSGDFSRVHARYCYEIHGALGDNPKMGYYASKVEAFARCYEIYITIRSGPSMILRDLTGSKAHPRTDRLDALVVDYFDGLISRGAKGASDRAISLNCAPPGNATMGIEEVVENDLGIGSDPRECRRTFGQRHLGSDLDTGSVSVPMGHASTETTESLYGRKRMTRAVESTRRARDEDGGRGQNG